MGEISVKLDDEVIARLRARAARNGRSMGAEATDILTAAVSHSEPATDLVAALRKAALAVGGVELDVPPRTEGHRQVDLPR